MRSVGIDWEVVIPETTAVGMPFSEILAIKEGELSTLAGTLGEQLDLHVDNRNGQPVRSRLEWWIRLDERSAQLESKRWRSRSKSREVANSKYHGGHHQHAGNPGHLLSPLQHDEGYEEDFEESLG